MSINKQAPWFRYGLALALFVITILIAVVLNALGFKLNLALVIVAVLLAAAWYGGRGPGLLLAILIEATIILANPSPEGTSIGAAVFGHLGVAALLVVLALFVGSRRNVEDKLREQGELLMVTLSSIGDAVISTDLRGRITFINPTAERLTGYVKEEAIGASVDEVFRIVSEHDRLPIESPLEMIKREGNLTGLPNGKVLISKNGRETPIDDSGAPIRDNNGNAIGAVIVFHDISGRRRAEQEREDLLSREQEARTEAEKANRLKDEFLGMVSHELRTPLNAILGWVSILESEKPANESVRHALDVIKRNAQAQDGIISDLLDVSRIVSGQLDVDLRPVELVPTIHAAIDALYPAAKAKSISIKTSLFDSACKVNGDLARLRQIFSNILSNAIKFTPRGGKIDIRLIQNDSRVEVRIADDGVGIAKPFLRTIFERFRQADSSMKRTHRGLGLGLAVVQHLVELHGGKIRAESRGVGKGATFTVEFDIVSASATSTRPVSPLIGAPELDGLRILVVDDDPDTLEMLCISLEKYGAQTHGAPSCAAAIEVFEQWEPDLVISDLAMPVEDGFDLIRKIRAMPDRTASSIPAAALTASARDEDALDALAAGFQVHIAKPVDPVRLASEVSELSKYIAVRH